MIGDPTDLFEELTEMKRRISTLERSRRVPQLSRANSHTEHYPVPDVIPDADWADVPGSAMDLTLGGSTPSRVFVALSTNVTVQGSAGAGGWIGIKLSGPTNVAATESFACIALENGYKRDAVFQIIEDLEPGDYQVIPQTKRPGGVSPAQFTLIDWTLFAFPLTE